MIKIDEGFNFGIGVFETIAVEEGKALLLKWHLERMEKGIKALSINNSEYITKVNEKTINEYLNSNYMIHGVLKIVVTPQNIVFSTRINPYNEENLKKGFKLAISNVIRNETSTFTYIKSLNYGDNYIEKSKAKAKGYDEVIFFNSKGELTETSASNIFLVKDKKIYTPKAECGLLEGTLRKYIMANYEVTETIIYKKDLLYCDEIFITNSLMGIMPVVSVEDMNFRVGEITTEMYKKMTR